LYVDINLVRLDLAVANSEACSQLRLRLASLLAGRDACPEA
jgi:hypothetical protein